MQLPTLYQRDSKGKIRQWTVWTEGDAVVVEHGIQGGKMQQQRTVAKAKNTGKVNETTPEQQAELEAQSKWAAQIEREDYAKDVEKAGLQTRPMLALDYTKVPHRVNWADTVSQRKLDGLRLVAGYRWADRKDAFEMLTRKGEVHNVRHLMDDSKLLLVEVNRIAMHHCMDACLAIDGEVYLHGRPLSWITSRARKHYKGETETLEYHVFDLVIPGLPFITRHWILSQALQSLHEMGYAEKIFLVEVDSLSSEDELHSLHGSYIQEGYEGLMIRHRSGMYRTGDRSPDLFKYKEFEEEECLIVGIYEDNNGNAMWSVRRKPTLEFGAGVMVGVTPKRTHAERKQMLQEPEKWIGQWATIRYQTVTPDGSLQFPTGRDLRKCNDLGEPLR